MELNIHTINHFMISMIEFQRFDCKADVGFLIDGSGSITNGAEHNWNLIKDLILVLAKDLNITEDGAHVAVAVFSDSATLDIKFSDFTDYHSFEERVIKLRMTLKSRFYAWSTLHRLHIYEMIYIVEFKDLIFLGHGIFQPDQTPNLT